MKRTLRRIKRQPPEKKSKTGRPTIYDPKVMIPKVLELMSQGLSRQELCLHLYKKGKITPATLRTWEKEHPEFLSAIKDGKQLEEAWWMNLGRVDIHNRNLNIGMYMIQMANRFSWQRKDEVVQTVKGGITQTYKHEYEHKFDFSNLETTEVEQFRRIVAKGISKSPEVENSRPKQTVPA